MSSSGLNATTIFSLVVFQNDSHTCSNSTSEIANYLQEAFLLTYFNIGMVILSSVNIALHLYSYHFFWTRRPAKLFTQLLIFLSFTEVGFNVTMFHNLLLTYLMELGLLTFSSVIGANLVSFLIIFGFVMVTAFHIARNWVVLMIALYRMRILTSPFAQQNNVAHMSKVPTGVTLVCFTALLIASPRIFEYTIYICSANLKIAYLNVLLMSNESYRFYYLGIVLGICQNVGPVLLVWLFSILLVYFLHRQQQRQRDLHRRTRDFTSRNKSVLIMCVVFLICQALTCFKAMLKDTELGSKQELIYLAHALASLNSTLNFFIFMSSHFHIGEKVSKLMARCACHRHNNDRVSTTQGTEAIGGNGASTRLPPEQVVPLLVLPTSHSMASALAEASFLSCDDGANDFSARAKKI